MGLDDAIAGAIKGLVTSGLAVIADQQKASAQVLAELHPVFIAALHSDSQDAFARRLAELNAEAPTLADSDVEDDVDPTGRP